MEKQFEEQGIKAHRLAGIDGSRIPCPKTERDAKWTPRDKADHEIFSVDGPSYATTVSFSVALRIAKWYQAPQFLYLEDDAILIDRFMEMVEMYLKKIPDDWDIFNLGGMQGGKVPYDKHFCTQNPNRVIWGASHMVVRDTAYDKIIAHLGTGPRTTVDVFLSSLPDIKIYMPQGMYHPQMAGFSDVTFEYMGFDEGRWHPDWE
jgi:GR25 family glycosyltransferase involved in LPS biosynthesis